VSVAANQKALTFPCDPVRYDGGTLGVGESGGGVVGAVISDSAFFFASAALAVARCKRSASVKSASGVG